MSHLGLVPEAPFQLPDEAPTDTPPTWEASTLGLPPGRWPQKVVYRGVTLTWLSAVTHAGELVAVRYLDDEGKIAVDILND